MDELVSIIIPCYNPGTLLPETLKSVEELDYPAKEIIIVNDGSTDKKTLEVLSQIKQEERAIVKDIPNGGPANARNEGFSISQGKYILLIDADDLVHPSFIKKAQPILENDPDTAAVSSWVQAFGTEGFLWKMEGGTVKNFIAYNSCTVFSIVRRSAWELVGGFDPSFRAAIEDWDFWLSITENAGRVHMIEEPLFYYRHRENNYRPEKFDKHPELFEMIYHKHRASFEQHMDYAIVERERMLAYCRKENARLKRIADHPVVRLLQKVKGLIK